MEISGRYQCRAGLLWKLQFAGSIRGTRTPKGVASRQHWIDENWSRLLVIRAQRNSDPRMTVEGMGLLGLAGQPIKNQWGRRYDNGSGTRPTAF